MHKALGQSGVLSMEAVGAGKWKDRRRWGFFDKSMIKVESESLNLVYRYYKALCSDEKRRKPPKSKVSFS